MCAIKGNEVNDRDLCVRISIEKWNQQRESTKKSREKKA